MYYSLDFFEKWLLPRFVRIIKNENKTQKQCNENVKWYETGFVLYLFSKFQIDSFCITCTIERVRTITMT